MLDPIHPQEVIARIETRWTRRLHGPMVRFMNQKRVRLHLTNDCYLVRIATKNFTERYYRDSDGWLKISARGRKFRMTAEQVLNHLLPALAGIKPNLTVTVEHHNAGLPEQ